MCTRDTTHNVALLHATWNALTQSNHMWCQALSISSRSFPGAPQVPVYHRLTTPGIFGVSALLVILFTFIKVLRGNVAVRSVVLHPAQMLVCSKTKALNPHPNFYLFASPYRITQAVSAVA
eukprot:scaffold6203_cov17-Tisochrysis_lutea.AAC.1